MTPRVVYGAAFAAVIVATTLTITSVLSLSWVTYDSDSASHSKPGPGTRVHDRIGLHKRCMSIDGDGSETCTPFPDDKKCALNGDQGLCSMWKTTGFLMNLAIVAELVTLIAFLIVMAGGKQKRERGWKVLGLMIGGVGLLEVAGMGIVTYLFNHDDMFLVPGYKLGAAWYLCTASAAITILVACGLALSAYVLPPEDGYEFLNDDLAGGSVS
ncbi:hypothetical protein V8F20_006984 [Naviculisporaceae sp. PSN 640]